MLIIVLLYIGHGWLLATCELIVDSQIMKINAGDHACPGNVGMQRTE